MRHASTFSGEGGFDLAAELLAWENIFQCEKDEFCLHILNYYWPNAKKYKNIIGQSFSKYRGIIDILSGGFPCQPYSVAGDRKGVEDDRHLWPEMLRAIQQIRPRWVVGENVSGIINWDSGVVFEQVCIDLEGAGYKVQPIILPACAVDAPHRRDRVFFIACRVASDAGSNGLKSRRPGKNKSAKSQGESEGNKWERIWNDYWGNGQQRTTTNTIDSRFKEWEDEYNRRVEEKNKSREDGRIKRFSNDGYVAYTSDEGLQRRQFGETPDKEKQKRGKQSSGSTSKLYKVADWSKFPTQSPVCSGDDGISARLDVETISKMTKSKRKSPEKYWREESLKCHGNAVVVPLIVELFKIIDFMEYLYKTTYND